jgi:hypothetical protein
MTRQTAASHAAHRDAAALARTAGLPREAALDLRGAFWTPAADEASWFAVAPVAVAAPLTTSRRTRRPSAAHQP